jgi:hypothetical protein
MGATTPVIPARSRYRIPWCNIFQTRRQSLWAIIPNVSNDPSDRTVLLGGSIQLACKKDHERLSWHAACTRGTGIAEARNESLGPPYCRTSSCKTESRRTCRPSQPRLASGTKKVPNLARLLAGPNRVARSRLHLSSVASRELSWTTQLSLGLPADHSTAENSLWIGLLDPW